MLKYVHALAKGITALVKLTFLVEQLKKSFQIFKSFQKIAKNF